MSDTNSPPVHFRAVEVPFGNSDGMIVIPMRVKLFPVPDFLHKINKKVVILSSIYHIAKYSSDEGHFLWINNDHMQFSSATELSYAFKGLQHAIATYYFWTKVFVEKERVFMVPFAAYGNEDNHISINLSELVSIGQLETSIPPGYLLKYKAGLEVHVNSKDDIEEIRNWFQNIITTTNKIRAMREIPGDSDEFIKKFDHYTKEETEKKK